MSNGIAIRRITPVTKLTGSANTMPVNNTSTSGKYTETPYFALAQQTYSSTIAWSATVAPSGTTTHTYSWSQIGNIVFFRINLLYSVAGTAATVVVMDKPADMPNPFEPTGFGAASSLMLNCTGGLAATLTAGTGNNGKGYVSVNAGDTGYAFTIQSAANNSVASYIQGFYFTN